MTASALQLRAASLLLWTNALGFGVFCVPAIKSLATGRGIPYVMGFPAYGAGPFERHGIPTTIPLIAGFLAVCLLEAGAGWLLWGSHRSGAVLALVLLIPGVAYWWGFALPIPPVFALIRTILIARAWQSLS